jgi:AcrR family transcriptional regulator
MARTVNPRLHAERRNQILDVAQHLIETIGYEQMTIQDVVEALQISKGALHHYFRTKPALLEALVERSLDELEQIVTQLADAPELPAIAKFQQFFALMVEWKSARQPLMLALLRSWHQDDNAIVRQKVRAATLARLGPLLTRIVHQGLREGCMSASEPDQVGDIILALIHGLQDHLARLHHNYAASHTELAYRNAVLAVHSAYLEALERVVGVAPGTLQRLDPATVQHWLTVLHDA